MKSITQSSTAFHINRLQNSTLLENHAGPLPMFQIHEFVGPEGVYDATDFRLWTVSD